MKTIKFISSAKDGIIEVPKKHLKNLSSRFEVIILVKEEKEPKKIKSKKKSSEIVPKKTKPKKDFFKSFKVKTKGFKFDRDEANER